MVDTVNVGAGANDGTGDRLRDAFVKANAKFSQILAAFNYRGDWVTATLYDAAGRDYVKQGGLYYLVTVSHTSGVFATDLASPKWVQVDLLAMFAALAAGGAGQGAEMVGYTPAGTGGVLTTLKEKVGRKRDFLDNLSVAQKADVLTMVGAIDITTQLNQQLAAGGHITVHPGRYKFSTLQMPVANTTLHIEAGAVLMPTVALAKAINITGANCTISGGGRIQSPATFYSVNVRRTYSTIWVDTGAHGFTGRDFILDTVPRCGIHFEDATHVILSNVRIYGNLPQSNYVDSGATFTGHFGIEYNPPTDGTFTGKPSFIVNGCEIRGCTQGVSDGNYDSAGSMRGVVINNNVMSDIWDHGIYDALGLGIVVVGNNFNDCHNPVVINGKGATVTGNTSYSEIASQSQLWSIRDCEDLTLGGNSITGYGAGMGLDCVAGTAMRNINLAPNTIKRLGVGTSVSGELGSAIRIGNGAQICENVIIDQQVISGTGFSNTVGVIQLEMAAGFFAKNTTLISPIITTADEVSPIQAVRHTGLKIKGGAFTLSHSAASAKTIAMMFLTDCAEHDIDGVEYNYKTGGTNVSIRGIQTAGMTTGLARNNRFFLNSASLASVDALGFYQSSGEQRQNQIDARVKLNGTFTWSITASAATVSNANLLATSRVVLTPLDVAAANIMGTGYYITYAVGTFTVTLATGLSAAASNWSYEIQ